MANTWNTLGNVDGQFSVLGYRGPASSTEATLALNSAFTYGSAGAAFFTTFVAKESANLTDLWVKVKSYAGTWGSTDGVINVQIREGLNGARIPGTTLTGSFTITLNGSTTGWIKKSGLSIGLTAGKMYCIVIGDADGGATNKVTLVTDYGSSNSTPSVEASESTTTTGGFASAGTASSGMPALVWKVGSDLHSGGGGYDTLATIASSTLERGMRFQVQEECTLAGFAVMASDISIMAGGHTVKLYADGVNPGGTPLLSFACPTTTLGGGSSPIPSAVVFPAANWTNLAADTWYRLAFKPASALTTPRKATITGSPDADVLAAIQPFNGLAYWTAESGGVWVDDTASISAFGPIIVPKEAAAGGSSRKFVIGS